MSPVFFELLWIKAEAEIQAVLDCLAIPTQEEALVFEDFFSMLSQEFEVIYAIGKGSVELVWDGPLAYVFADVVGCVGSIQYTPSKTVSALSVVWVDWNIVYWYLSAVVREVPSIECAVDVYWVLYILA